MRKETAEKMVIMADNSTAREIKSFEIDSAKPFEEDWKSLGDDYFEGPKGVCGPSGGDPTRTFVPFGDPKGDNSPTCPVCNGNIGENFGSDCDCDTIEIRNYYGI